jgi:hypothetical protein
LEADKNYLVLYNGENSVPITIDLDESVDFSRVIYEMNTGIVKGTPKWGQRANASVFNHMTNALIYMVPEHIKHEDMVSDWKMMMMVSIIEMMQEHETGFIPITAVHGENYVQSVPHLTKLIDAKKEELPNFYVLNPLTEQVVPYPGDLGDVK